MTGLVVLIVDDEPLARRRIIRLLNKLDWVGRIEEAGNVEDARMRSAALRPDILLLDIQMPGGDGFELLERLHDVPPAVVFVTALDHHALRAFEVRAVDYLTKPVEPGRFLTAMERARSAAQSKVHAEQLDELKEMVASLKRALADHAKPRGEFWVRKQGEYVRVAASDIVRFQADRDYARLYVRGSDYLYQENLTSLERRLDPADFMRIHRGTIVRRDAVLRVKPGPFASLIVCLVDGSEVRVGRTYMAAVRARLVPRF